MKTIFVIDKSTRKNKKYMISQFKYVDGKYKKIKTTHFGDSQYEDFTTHKDPERRSAYVLRHMKQEKKYWDHDVDNLMRAAYMSLFLLWNRPTIKQSFEFIKSKFKDNKSIQLCLGIDGDCEEIIQDNEQISTTSEQE